MIWLKWFGPPALVMVLLIYVHHQGVKTGDARTAKRYDAILAAAKEKEDARAETAVQASKSVASTPVDRSAVVGLCLADAHCRTDKQRLQGVAPAAVGH